MISNLFHCILACEVNLNIILMPPLYASLVGPISTRSLLFGVLSPKVVPRMGLSSDSSKMIIHFRLHYFLEIYLNFRLCQLKTDRLDCRYLPKIIRRMQIDTPKKIPMTQHIQTAWHRPVSPDEWIICDDVFSQQMALEMNSSRQKIKFSDLGEAKRQPLNC